jgi:CRP/FNR family transcriptional regulator/CRP/FNR family cyclic AMP-dependent transcriptional regulator
MGARAVARELELLQKYFREVPLFRHLPPKHAAVILRDFAIRRVKKDEIIVSQEEPGTELFIVLQGRVRVALLSEEGEEFILNELGPGEFFGEVSLVDAEPRSASVIAEASTTLAALRRERLLAALRDEPQIALDLLAALACIVRRATERERQFAFRDVRQRLCRYFSRKKAEEGVKDVDGFVRIARRTHKHLATRIGASRESVTKALKGLARDELIREQGEDFLLSPRISAEGDDQE